MGCYDCVSVLFVPEEQAGRLRYGMSVVGGKRSGERRPPVAQASRLHPSPRCSPPGDSPEGLGTLTFRGIRCEPNVHEALLVPCSPGCPQQRTPEKSANWHMAFQPGRVARLAEGPLGSRTRFLAEQFPVDVIRELHPAIGHQTPVQVTIEFGGDHAILE